MSEQIKMITKETLIPIGIAITLLGGVFYLGTLAAQIKQNASDIGDNGRRISALEVSMQAIQQSQTKSETKLDYILDNLGEIKKKLNIN